MKKSIIALGIFVSMLTASLPAFSACPISPCESCDTIYTTAGVVNYDKAQKRTNFGVIAKERQLNEFERLVKISGLKHKVDKGNYTVFAPTNDAIKNMGQGTVDYLKRPENRDELVRFVMAHMTEGANSGYCLCEQQAVTDLNCCQYEVQKCCNRLSVGNSCVIAPDIATKNGRVHVINRTLYPYS
jgi:uncharacterized surface protein with fasciclin (FAS1) repeats